MCSSDLAALPAVALAGVAIVKMLLGGVSNPVSAVGSLTVLLLAILLFLACAIPVYMAMWFAPALVVLHDMAPIEAVRRSFGASMKNMVPFLVYGFVLVVLSVIAAIPLMLGLLVLAPVVVASVYTSYRDIFFDR